MPLPSRQVDAAEVLGRERDKRIREAASQAAAAKAVNDRDVARRSAAQALARRRRIAAARPR